MSFVPALNRDSEFFTLMDSHLYAHQLRTEVLNLADTGVIALDPNRRIILWNDWIARASGISSERAIGARFQRLFPGLTQHRLLDAIDMALSENMSSVLSQTLHPAVLPLFRTDADRHANQRIEQQINVIPLNLTAGTRCCLVQIADVTAAVVREKRLREQAELGLRMADMHRQGEAQLRSILETAVDAIVTIDEDGSILMANPMTERMFGYSNDELVGHNIEILMPEPFRSRHDQYLENHRKTGRTKVIGGSQEVMGRRKDGSCFSLELSVSVMQRNGQRCFTGILRDISRRKLIEAQLSREKERAEITLACIAEGVLTTDKTGRVESINKVAALLLECEREEIVGTATRDVLRIVEEDTDAPVLDPVQACLNQEGAELHAHTGRLVHADGSTIFISYTVAPITTLLGDIVGAVMVFRDCTQQRALMQQVSYQASHDSLTALPNRLEFERRLAMMLERSRQDRVQHAMLYLDLDQFKLVNDTCGHAAGDELLRQLTGLLRLQLRQRDTLARLGGDEFGVLLGECPLERAEAIAEQLREIVERFRFAWEERWFRVGVSVGLVPFGGGDEMDLKTILSAADSACYLAKEQGRNRVHVYQPGQGELEQRRDEMRWATRIHQALAENRFCLYFQPIVPLGPTIDTAQRGEVLLRLADEHGRILAPSAFIPAAERYNQMQSIDRWVVRKSFEIVSQASAEGNPVSCSINLSGQSLSSAEFAGFVLTELRATRADPSLICFEVTETAAIGNLDAALTFIGRLKDQGCRFALDDFGSGVSSFAYLKSLPIDFLKIDGQFVENIASDPIDYAMVEAIHRLAQLMGLRTIAERIENQETLLKLTSLGIDYGQGYGIARPEPFGMQTQHAAPLAKVAPVDALI